MITLTGAAQEKLENILASQPDVEPLVRVSVIRGPHGCVHGWNLGFDRHKNDTDTLIDAGALQLVVEADLIGPLDGARIDYREDAVGIGFMIEAPNAGGGCDNH